MFGSSLSLCPAIACEQTVQFQCNIKQFPLTANCVVLFLFKFTNGADFVYIYTADEALTDM